MRKLGKMLGVSAALTISMGLTAFAGQWQRDGIGWWWQEDDGTYAVSSWQWIDGNQDGVYERYYFDGNGYLAVNTVVDGCQVNEDGCWMENGHLMTRQTGQAALDVLQQVLADSEKQTSMDADILINTQVSGQGGTQDVSMSGNMKVMDADNAQMQYRMDLNMNLRGLTIPISTFYTDGYLYMEALGQKVKSPMDFETALEAAQSLKGDYGSDLSYIRDVSVVDQENGTRTIYYEMDGSKLEGMIQMTQDLMGSTGEQAAASITAIHLCKAEATLDEEGLLLQQRVQMDMAASVGEIPLDYSIFMELNIKNPGQPVTFTLPSTEGYAEEGVQ